MLAFKIKIKRTKKVEIHGFFTTVVALLYILRVFFFNSKSFLSIIYL